MSSVELEAMNCAKAGNGSASDKDIVEGSE